MSELALQGDALMRRHGPREIIRGVSIAIRPAESVALVGPSGSGKTTLLQMLGLLDRPDAGSVHIRGVDAWSLGSRGRARLRAQHVGFVFQRENLLDHINARDNVALCAWQTGMSWRQARQAAGTMLERFGLGARADGTAAVLSPGERQRVAIARALIKQPAIVLADEPTGSLDSDSASVVLAALAEICASGAALLVVTHNPEVAAQCARTVTMRDGRLIA